MQGERHTIGAMKTLSLAPVALPFALAATLLAGGCSKQAPQQAAAQPAQTSPAAPAQQAINPNVDPVQQQPPALAQQQATNGYAATAPQAPLRDQAATGTAERSSRDARRSSSADASEAKAAPASYTIPAGTHISVTTTQEISSKTAQAGQTFSATVASPVTVGGRTLIRSGSTATGTIVDAKSQGRFKGEGGLSLRLDSVRSGGESYDVESSTIDQVQKGKGKRTAVMAGGGGGLGALIGGLAGGGKGALIGALAGAGGGTAGAAFTGNKATVIPAETTLTFRLERSVTVSR